MEETLENLSHNQKLVRDKAIEHLEQSINDFDSDQIAIFERSFVENLGAESETNQVTWELKHGYLCAVRLLVVKEKLSPTFLDRLVTDCMRFLSDQESRIRVAAGQVLGALCRAKGLNVFDTVSPHIVDLIRNDLQRAYTPLPDGRISRPSSSGSASPIPPVVDDDVVRKLMASHDGDSDAARLLHDTAGWRYLETSMNCLQYMADGCGALVLQRLDRNLFDLLIDSTLHTNRFVRETSYYLFDSFLKFAPTGTQVSHQSKNPIICWMSDVAECLCRGLSDNWSQVRLAASVATRSLIETYPDPAPRAIYLELLLPAMCLNRYYLAEGVRLYSQETWRRLTVVSGCEGIKLVGQYLPQVCSFYISQTTAENHAVREAACHSIAELAAKLDPSLLAAHIDALVDTLIGCFDDDSWPVRDATCLACGRLLSLMPAKAQDNRDKLISKFQVQLEDCIPSVRQGAAESLAQVVVAVDEWSQPVLVLLKEALGAVRQQADDSQRYTGLEPGTANYGVVKKHHDNDQQKHTDQTMYSCGSLAPKMGRGNKADGCTGGHFRRDAQPWETSDGAIQLYAQLVHLNAKLWWPRLQPLWNDVMSACSHRAYVHHVQLLATFCKQLIVIVNAVSKQQFKPVLQSCLDPVFYCATVESELSRVAAEDCLMCLARVFGPNIIRGRVEMMDNSLSCIEVYDRLVNPLV